MSPGRGTPWWPSTCYELAEFGRLRNFVWHSKGHVLASWAEPTQEAVERLGKLVEAIVAPEPLLPRFEGRICIFPPPTPLVEALTHMKENDYSQVVVQGADDYGLLSVEGIARWVEHSHEADLISVRDATVGDAAAYKPEWSFVRLGRKHTIEDARQSSCTA
jgi:hypothetical protein